VPYTYLILFIVVALAVLASIKTWKLTVAGGITGGIMAIVIYLGVGVFGILMLGSFFLLGTSATAWQSNTKNKLGIAEKGHGQRTMGQVLANGGVAGLLGLLAIWNAENLSLWAIMTAGSLSAATADTLSSELGSLYGKRFYNCITFKKDQRGLDGVISVEGVLIGIVGSALIAVVYSAGFGWTVTKLLIVIGAGTIGNLADSVLGATLERKEILQNNMVNFLNTMVGALAAMALFMIHLYSY
jgi:uncharacterized protein (TIGR00297 family)